MTLWPGYVPSQLAQLKALSFPAVGGGEIKLSTDIFWSQEYPNSAEAVVVVECDVLGNWHALNNDLLGSKLWELFTGSPPNGGAQALPLPGYPPISGSGFVEIVNQVSAQEIANAYCGITTALMRARCNPDGTVSPLLDPNSEATDAADARGKIAGGIWLCGLQKDQLGLPVMTPVPGS